jgi:hypothetical protein
LATTYSHDESPAGPATTVLPRHADRGFFFVGYAWVCLAVAVLGFAPSFWIPLGSARYGDTGMVLAHGIVFTAWPLLFLWQTVQVERGAIANHRAWGVAGVSLATMMLLVGIATAEAQLADRLAAGFGDRARAFAIVPLTTILLFFGLFVAAVANVVRPDWHKRLMMCASAVVLVPAFARIIFYLVDGRPLGPVNPGAPPTTPELVLRPALLVLALLIGAASIDRRRRGGALHPAWLWAIGAFVLVSVGRLPVARTEAWYAMADALAAFG